MFPKLERLNLSFCMSLSELHPSVGFLDKLVYFDIKDCYNLKMFPRIVNMKSLQEISFEGCKRLKNFPEIVGRMESLKRMNLSRTAIKEVPSSIGYDLFNLQVLYLQKCENLTNLPLSIYELQDLRYLQLKGCTKLVLIPFLNKEKYCEVLAPTSNSNISHYGKATSIQEADDDADDGQGNLAFPSLRYFFVGGCYTSDCDFLVTLGCASTLKQLDFSESNFVSLPASLPKFINLECLNLSGCKRLQDVLELPPNLKRLYVRGCVSLERISKLSNILKHQESQMFEQLDLSNCWRLCDNLVQEAEKKGLLVNDGDHQVEVDLFSLFLSSQKSAFRVVFPASHEILEWFSCQMDFKGNGLFEFYIQVLPNFKWENTGLVLYVAADEMLNWGFEIRINKVLVRSNLDDRFCKGFHEADSARVWLHYIPFDRIDMRLFGYRRPLPPFQCRVTIYQTLNSNVVPLKRCGVHLVMPPNEVCMKLSQTQNLRNRLKAEVYVDELESSDSNSKLAYSSREEGPSGLKRGRIDL
ncbi:disease resistance protein RPP2B [Rosa chinensis]|uniref:disease resistance protein RPP2B n=1 Tax=Rosa chinensis TaxID=74649 RepID=UPI001AD8FDAB|nr:disease resistance protein RPP2B [Rosa chinensis]